MIYTVTLNPAVDYVMGLSALVPGQINRAERENIVFGGKGINVSVMLHTLGVESVALGFVAGFTGDAVENGLAAEGIQTNFQRVENGFSRINVKLHAGVETEINGSGPEIDADTYAAFLKTLSALTAADTLVLSGSVPRSLPKTVYAEIAVRAADSGARLVADAAGRLLLDTLSAEPFLIKPNRAELSELFDAPAETEAQTLALARKLQEKGAQNVLVSMAGDGALLLLKTGEAYRAPAAAGTVVNSVGAGDAMVGGFLAAVSRGKSFEEALALGTAAGGATAFSIGTAPFQKVMAIFEAVRAGVTRIG